jgi:hypothetical protein
MLSAVVLGLIGLSLLGLAGSGGTRDGFISALVLLVPGVLICLGFLVVLGRSAVIIESDEVLIRPFAGRSRHVPRSDVVGVTVVNCGNELIPAAAPSLRLTSTTESVDLLPLMAWTWWRSGTPARVSRHVARLSAALGLD